MSNRKRTAELEADIRARHRAGLSAREIAKEKGVSRQTIDRVLASAPPPRVAQKAPAAVAQPSKRPPVAQTEEPEPADLDELRVLMSELARGLAAQAREAHGTGDAAAYVALAGKAQSAALALAKLSPEAPEAEQEGQYVTHDAMAKAAAAARTLILDRVARRARGGT